MSGCEPGRSLRVAVLVSGGVDSSLALRLVRSAGHQARAFYLQIWFQEDFRNFWDECPWEEDLRYARQVCEEVGVELEVVPMTQQYWERVVAASVAEIKAGHTPNPDMLCNSRVKFGAFHEYLQESHPGEFDRVASGHYARLVREHSSGGGSSSGGGGSSSSSSRSSSDHGRGEPAKYAAAQDADRRGTHAHASTSTSSGAASTGVLSSHGAHGAATAAAAAEECVRLALTQDAVKDQTYFLAHLSPAQLARCMFPLGSLTKPQVRALAAAAGLATSGRKDSQGICFLGKVRFSEFVKEHLGEWPGPIVCADNGRVLGVHNGFWFYTVGQRGGIKLPGGPWYVMRKDMRLNVVYVSRAYHEGDKRRDAFTCGPINWLTPGLRFDPGAPLYCKVRHGPNMYSCSLDLLKPQLQDGWSSASSAAGGKLQQYARVRLEQDDQGLAAGQYAVFYQDGVCLAAAKIVSAVS